MIEIRRTQIEDTTATRNAYNALYATRGLVHRDSFYLWLIGLLNPRPGGYLLDISCGEGRLVVLAQQLKVFAYGLDFSEIAVRKGAAHAQPSSFIIGDGEHLPLASNSFDYVTHIGSLEHYINPLAGVREIARVLKADGKACVLLPNAFSLLGIHHVWKHGEVHDDGQPLQRYATRRTWQHLLESGGLCVERVIGYSGIAFPRNLADARWLITHPMKIMRLLLFAMMPLHLSNHFVFICSRQSSVSK